MRFPSCVQGSVLTVQQPGGAVVSLARIHAAGSQTPCADGDDAWCEDNPGCARSLTDPGFNR